MRDPLNFFEPWELLPAGHENQLTRAFLVVLRHSPLAHQAWLRIVAPERALHQLDRATFRTQTGRIMDVGARIAEERIPGISVIQAADAPVIGGDIVDSSRTPVYDGIVTYGDDLVIVVENKLDGPASDRQARHINRHDANIEFDPRPRAVSWRDILDAFADLVDADRSLAGGAEKALIEDFLEYCQRHFSRLLPFSTLRRCAGDKQRMRRRFAAVLSAIAPDPQDADGHKLMLPEAACVERAYLDADPLGSDPTARVSIWMFPADTLGQARHLWPHADKVRALRGLLDSGWELHPHMHFAYRGTQLLHTFGPIDVDGYIDYWHENIGTTNALKPSQWSNYWQRLADAGIADPDDRARFDASFTNTNRHNAVPCPGLRCGKGWSRSAAEAADEAGALGEMARDVINEMLRAVAENELVPVI